MTLLKGQLVSYESRVALGAPTIVAFQYNPTTITRVLRIEAVAEAGSDPTKTVKKPVEEYTFELQLDATDGLERGPLLAPITAALGISPRIAALEMLMEPVANKAPGGALTEGGKTTPRRLPFVLLLWGAQRVTPIQLTSLTITESAFDDLLNPIQATAQLQFRAIREDDLPDNDALARGAARYYASLRTKAALVQLAQVGELSG